MSSFNILKQQKGQPIKAAIFDFDGTLSTLRYGWEEIMLGTLCKVLEEANALTDERKKEVLGFIHETTGVQTVFQMQKFEELLAQWGVPNDKDAWFYKDLYNEDLMTMVRTRTQKLLNGQANPGDFRIAGSVEFLQTLADKGVQMFIASGTDHEDVVREVTGLEFLPFFKDIKGAPHRKMSCPKEAAFTYVTQELGIHPSQVLIAGDGKVEISLADKHGSWALAIASNEAARQGIDPIKEKRLIEAGAWALSGDFLAKEEILAWLNI
ncbi:MAG: HAD family hydrolase [Brevinema sp.]